MKFFIVLFILTPVCAFSWGQVGHRIVGQLAFENLSKKSKKEIKKILGNTSLAESATWPDEVRSDSHYEKASTWHYVTIADGENYFSKPRNSKGDVIEAMCRMEDTLRDNKSSPIEKSEALKFLVHFVGDVHMPLHVGKGDDRGGNDFKVKWFNNDKNLHAVWDEDMVEFEKLSYSEYSKILNHYSKIEREEWATGTYLDWAYESMSVRNSLYPADPNIGFKYHFQFKPLMRERIKKAGLRLATILNNIFNNISLSKDESDLREKIKGSAIY